MAVLVFLASLPAVTTRLYASDEVQFFAYLRSLWFDHDVSFENEYRYFYERGIAQGGTRPRASGDGVIGDGFHQTFLVFETGTGLRYNFGTIGSAILWAPFYGVADAGVRVARWFGAETPADGFSRPYIAAVTYGSAVYGFLAVLLAAAVARRLTGHGAAAAAVVWVGTPLLFYMYVAPGMSHATSAFAVAAFVSVWLSVRRRWSVRGAMALGALGALVAMVREQDLFFLLPAAADLVWTAARAIRGPDAAAAVRRYGMAAVAGATTCAVCYLPQALSYLALNGWLAPADVVARKMTWTAPYAALVLLSPSHGLFFWTPVAALGLAGLVRLAVRPARGEPETRRVALLLLSMAALQVYVSGAVESWTVAGTFGQRRFVSLTVLLTVGLAAWWGGRTRPTVLGAVGVALAVWWNLALIVQFGSGTMDRQRLELARNAYNAFVVVPRRVPDVVYRYLFDRQSFYAPRPATPAGRAPSAATPDRP